MSVEKEKKALAIIDRLRERGFVAYLAGGCVRDRVLGVEAEGLRHRDRRASRGRAGIVRQHGRRRRALWRDRRDRSTATPSRSPPSAPTHPTSTVAVPRRCASARSRRTRAGATSPSAGCTSTRRADGSSTWWAGCAICAPALSARSATPPSASRRTICACCARYASPPGSISRSIPRRGPRCAARRPRSPISRPSASARKSWRS